MELKKQRIASIDILRGFIMLLMLIDHVRERFCYHLPLSDPMDIHNISSQLFVSRIMTHFCAPIFVFLTGLSAWLYANPSNKPKRSPGSFLFKRGLFLIVLEITLVNFSWLASYKTLYLQVIWAIGLSMISLSVLSKLPRVWIGCIGFIIVFGHNFLTPIHFEPNEMGYHIWTILHDRGYVFDSEFFRIKASYPILPWIGVILIGYFFGTLYTNITSSLERQKKLILTGVISLLLLGILRGFNIYGETLPWTVQESLGTTIMSFVNFTKYPPSLNYILFTLGVGMLLLALFESIENKLTAILKVFGSVPMFFYLLHLYVLLVLYIVSIKIFGPNHGNYLGFNSFYYVWIMWFILAVILYFPSKAFSNFKKKSTSKLIKYF